jgi:hypothetical protein
MSKLNKFINSDLTFLLIFLYNSVLLTLFLQFLGQIISDDSIAKEAIFTKTPPSGENILKVDDTAFKIIINGPWIRNLKLPSCILQDCFVYPSKYEHQFASDKLTVFQWWRQENKEFVPVGQGEIVGSFIGSYYFCNFTKFDRRNCNC